MQRREEDVGIRHMIVSVFFKDYGVFMMMLRSGGDTTYGNINGWMKKLFVRFNRVCIYISVFLD